MYNLIYPKKKTLEEKIKTLSFLNSITEKANVMAEQNGGGLTMDEICNLVDEAREEIRQGNNNAKILCSYWITLESKESIDKNTYLITGNEKHFNCDLDFIVRPKEMLNIIENSLKWEH